MTDFKDILRLLRAGDARAPFCALPRPWLCDLPGDLRRRRRLALRQALTAVRDAESRMRFLGYRVEGYKLFVFVLSAAMAGVAARSTSAGRHHQSQRILAGNSIEACSGSCRGRAR